MKKHNKRAENEVIREYSGYLNAITVPDERSIMATPYLPDAVSARSAGRRLHYHIGAAAAGLVAVIAAAAIALTFFPAPSFSADPDGLEGAVPSVSIDDDNKSTSVNTAADSTVSEKTAVADGTKQNSSDQTVFNQTPFAIGCFEITYRYYIPSADEISSMWGKQFLINANGLQDSAVVYYRENGEFVRAELSMTYLTMLNRQLIQFYKPGTDPDFEYFVSSSGHYAPSVINGTQVFLYELPGSPEEGMYMADFEKDGVAVRIMMWGDEQCRQEIVSAVNGCTLGTLAPLTSLEGKANRDRLYDSLTPDQAKAHPVFGNYLPAMFFAPPDDTEISFTKNYGPDSMCVSVMTGTNRRIDWTVMPINSGHKARQFSSEQSVDNPMFNAEQLGTAVFSDWIKIPKNSGFYIDCGDIAVECGSYGYTAGEIEDIVSFLKK